MPLPLLSLALFACLSAPASVLPERGALASTDEQIAAHPERPQIDPRSPRIDQLSEREIAQLDARGAAAFAERTLKNARIQREPMKRAIPAAAHIAVTCPFGRASFQLALAMQIEVARIDAEALDPLIQHDWLYLQRGLATHTAVLDELQVDLAAPWGNDFLAFRLAPDAMQTRAQLQASSSPVADTLPLIESIESIVQQYDARTEEDLSNHYQDLHLALDVDGALQVHLVSWLNTLERVRPFILDPALASRIETMTTALHALNQRGC